MSIIDNMKEQRKIDKEEAIKAFGEAKEYAKESFSKEHREKILEANVNRLKSSEMKEFTKTQYTTHMKLFLIGILFLMFGFIFPPLFLIALVLEFSGLVCMAKNWKKINREYKERKNIK